MKTADELRRELDRGDNVEVLRPGPAANGKPNGHAADGLPIDITPIRFPDLEGRDPPPRRFIVEDWIPAGCVTSLYGPGGIGKSMLAQQAATAVAVGRELFGHRVEKGPVLGLMCEDDRDELWRRQIRVNEWFACRMADLGDLHLEGRAGLENTLAVYHATGAPTVEAFHELIREAARALRPVLIILDPIAQLFGGDENDRFEVSHFVNLVGGLAREFACAVLLLGHPGKADGSEYSGSTAWNASVRSRLLLQRKEGDDDELLLSRIKSNYAQPNSLSLLWVDGTLRPTAQGLQSPEARIAAEALAAKARSTFLAGLDRLTAQGRNVSHSDRATNYAPKVMVQVGLGNGFREKALAAAMEGLLESGAIGANAKLWTGPDRKPLHGLARLDACGKVVREGCGKVQKVRDGTVPQVSGRMREGVPPPLGGNPVPHRTPRAKRDPQPSSNLPAEEVGDTPAAEVGPEAGPPPPPADEPDEFDL